MLIPKMIQVFSSVLYDVKLLNFCSQGIYEQLNLAAEAFIEGDDGCQVDMNKKQVKLSQILKWYSVDFGKNKEEVQYSTITVTVVKMKIFILFWEGGGWRGGCGDSHFCSKYR